MFVQIFVGLKFVKKMIHQKNIRCAEVSISLSERKKAPRPFLSNPMNDS